MNHSHKEEVSMFNAKASFGSKSERYNTPKALFLIPISNINFNISNQPRLSYSNRKYEALRNSIIQHGIVTPVTIFSPSPDLSDPKSIKGDLLDGFNRFQIACEIGLKEIPAIIETSSSEAEKIILLSNTTRNNLHPIECGRLINDNIKNGLINTTKSTLKYDAIEKYLNWKKATAVYYETLANNIPDDVARHIISLDFRNKEKLLKIAKICKLEDLRSLGSNDVNAEIVISRIMVKVEKILSKNIDSDSQEIDPNTSHLPHLKSDKKASFNRILFLEDSKGRIIGENMLAKMSNEELDEILTKNYELSNLLKKLLHERSISN